MATAKQIGILVVALLIGGGFAFGGIASYAGIAGSQQSNQQEFDAEVPSTNYQEEPYDMSLREQRILAYQNDIVFVNTFYDTQEQKQQLENLQSLTDRFDDRVYLSVANSSASSEIMITYGIVDFPAAVVNGGSGVAQPENITESSVSEAICDTFRSLGDQSAQCL